MSLSDRWRAAARARLSQELEAISARLEDPSLPEEEVRRLVLRQDWIEKELGGSTRPPEPGPALIRHESHASGPPEWAAGPPQSPNHPPATGQTHAPAELPSSQEAPGSKPDFEHMSDTELMRYLQKQAEKDPELRPLVEQAEELEEPSGPSLSQPRRGLGLRGTSPGDSGGGVGIGFGFDLTSLFESSDDASDDGGDGDGE